MKIRREKLGDTAAVKGTMVQAHLLWADSKIPNAQARLLDVAIEETEIEEIVRRIYAAGAR